MKQAVTGVLTRIAHESWATINARLDILASDEESAYYAWADEHLDALHADFLATKPALTRPAKRPTLDEI